MEREILFRGFHEDKTGSKEIILHDKKIKGEWVEGYYGIKGKDTDLERSVIMVSTLNNSTSFYPFYFEDIEVIPETVGQYTGLLDKNKVKIFENDIVNVFGKPYNCKPSLVVFGNKKCGFLLHCYINKTNKHDPNFKYYGLETSKCIEVIGKIFENPELLK